MGIDVDAGSTFRWKNSKQQIRRCHTHRPTSNEKKVATAAEFTETFLFSSKNTKVLHREWIGRIGKRVGQVGKLDGSIEHAI